MTEPEAFARGVLFILCAGITLLSFGVWLPWFWKMTVDNARWLYANGDRSWLIRQVLRLSRLLDLISGGGVG